MYDRFAQILVDFSEKEKEEGTDFEKAYFLKLQDSFVQARSSTDGELAEVSSRLNETSDMSFGNRIILHFGELCKKLFPESVNIGDKLIDLVKKRNLEGKVKEIAKKVQTLPSDSSERSPIPLKSKSTNSVKY